MDESTQQIVQSALRSHQDMPGSLLPILHAIQDALGYVSPDALPQVAKALLLSRAEVHGVVSFYPHFRTTPPGKHVIRVCGAESTSSSARCHASAWPSLKDSSC